MKVRCSTLTKTASLSLILLLGLSFMITDKVLAQYPDTSMEDSYMNTMSDSRGFNNFDFGFEVSHIKYEEPNFMEEEGEMFGLFGSYTHRTSYNQHIRSIKDAFKDGNKINVYKIDAKIAYGILDYTSNGSGTLDDIEDYMFEIRGVAGYDFPVNTNSRITPYVGVGFRYLNDDLTGTTSTGALGYERESHYVYLPIGVEYDVALENDWSITVTGEYDLFLSGKQESHLEDVNPSFNTVKNDQNDGFGVRGSIRITKNTDRVELFIEPFFRYWQIDDSDISAITYGGALVGYGLEPKNESTEYGLKIGINY